MTCEGQIFSGVQWSLLSERVGALGRQVAAIESPGALDGEASLALIRSVERSFRELLILLEPFVRDLEHHPHVADTHRGPVGG
jgi:hypothetical protein